MEDASSHQRPVVDCSPGRRESEAFVRELLGYRSPRDWLFIGTLMSTLDLPDRSAQEDKVTVGARSIPVC